MPTIPERLTEYEIFPKERLGQHILVDENLLNFIANQISPGANVIEIGAGPGNLTEALTHTAKHVIGIEIDRQYQDILEDLQTRINIGYNSTQSSVSKENPFIGTVKQIAKKSQKVSIIFGDAIKINYNKIIEIDRDGEWEIAANIPYHISEPFLKILSTIPIHSAVLMVGDNFGKTISTENPRSDWYTKSSFIANAFFSVETIKEIPSKSFYPVPRTESYLMRLTPVGHEDTNPWNPIFRQLVRNERTKPIRSILETSFSSANISDTQRTKKERNRYDRREINRELANIAKYGIYAIDDNGSRSHKARVLKSNIGSLLNLPDRILGAQFGSLNNEDLRTLALSIQNYFSR